ncbi:sodium-coupled monocarboxylate transporter 2-like [Eriocheir sinensis]|uniref:sodium-coupled monocarboxylate transporter 2-like n=1 Tax=Eriocheir sinensis TaxID=95602 RepID=UPI0021C9C269|nr:sodium-coupled monocarboxylate transporter 2-like [Eriocheir sinensis]
MTNACPANLTIPPPPPPPVTVADLNYPEKFLGVSYTQLGVIGLLVGLVFGILVSLLTGKSRGHRVDPLMVHPWVRWAVPKPEELEKRVKAHSYDNKISTKF